MLIRMRRGWELPESAATSEAVFHDRRRLLQGLAAGPILAAAGLGNGAAWAADADPSASLYPAKRNELYHQILDAIQANKLNGNISLKLTHMGLDVDEALARELVGKLVARAAARLRVM